MVTEPDDGGDPRVTLRMPEKDLEAVRAIAGENDYDYSMGHVIRYSMDRAFEDMDVEWTTMTEKDPELEKLFDSYGFDTEGVAEPVNEEARSLLEEFEDKPLDTVNPGLEDFDRAVTMYGLARDLGDRKMEELATSYLKSEFSDTYFTENIIEAKE